MAAPALAVDFSVSSQLAARWVAELARAGAVEVVGIHFYWPAQEAYRLGLLGWRGHGEPDPVVAETLERELRAQLASISAAAPLRLRLEPHGDQRAERLVQLAQDERADLIVVGSHERGALARLWEQSVSRGALRAARCSVVCVPMVPGAASNKMPARVNNVLAESAQVALAIFQAAERLGVDVLCLGTHGRTGLARVLLGSVTHAILEPTGRPLLLARAPVA